MPGKKNINFGLKDRGIEILRFLPNILNLRLGSFNEKHIPFLLWKHSFNQKRSFQEKKQSLMDNTVMENFI